MISRPSTKYARGAETFDQAVLRTGQLSPVSELERTGIEKVRLVSRSQLAELTRLAVNRAIRALISEIDLSPEALASVQQRAELEYSLLVEAGLEPSTGDLRQTLEAEDSLLDALAHGSSRADDRPADAPGDVAALEARVVRNLGEILEKDWQTELREVQQGHQRQMDLLETRIAKLVNALESTDRILHQLQSQPEVHRSLGVRPASGSRARRRTARSSPQSRATAPA